MRRPSHVFNNLPIRIRLTTWYSSVFAAALLCITAVSLWMVHRAVAEMENNELQQRVRSVRRFLEARPRNEAPNQLHDAITAAYDVSHGSKWLQVIDDRGNWIYRSPHVAALYPSLTHPEQISDPVYFTYTAESVHVRALIEPITVHGVKYTVQTGLSLSKSLAILSNFRAQLYLLTALGLLFSSLAGYLMTRKALTPIAEITAEAQRINDKSLSLRLPELETRDELAALSHTLNNMLGRIEAGYESVRSFTASAAHELRSPVALLRAETEVALAFSRDADYYRDTCKRVLKSSEHMTRLIEQLLMLARADAGIEPLHFETINLPDLIAELSAAWVDRFAEANVTFTCTNSACELWVEADYIALTRLVQILLENAWRYTPSGQSVTLSLSAMRAGSVEIRIADTGIGIAPADQERIFERFGRLGQPLHGEFTGSGLGLALAQWIAVRHTSRIQLESFLGKGSCFSIVLSSIAPPRPFEVLASTSSALPHYSDAAHGISE